MTELPVLVSGASGFIGRRLSAALVREGVSVRCLVRTEDAAAIPELADCELVYGDLGDPESVERATRGTGTVFHLAALVGDWLPLETARAVNVEGTQTLLSAASRAGARAIVASSVIVYGQHLSSRRCDESLAHGQVCGSYGATKVAQEEIAERWMRESRGVVVLRLANTYGPRSRIWVDTPVEYLRSGLPSLIGRGSGDAQLLHVDNAVAGFIAAWRTPDARGAYNLADGHDISWAQYLGDLANVARTPPPRSMPAPVAHALASASETLWRTARRNGRPPLTREALQILESRFPIPTQKARNELGFEAKVSYEDGMASVAEYLGTLD